MTFQHLHRIHNAQPFEPYRLHLADGRSVEVAGPQKMLFWGKGRVVVVTDSDDDLHILDVLMITDIQMTKKPTRETSRNGRPRRRHS